TPRVAYVVALRGKCCLRSKRSRSCLNLSSPRKTLDPRPRGWETGSTVGQERVKFPGSGGVLLSASGGLLSCAASTSRREILSTGGMPMDKTHSNSRQQGSWLQMPPVESIRAMLGRLTTASGYLRAGQQPLHRQVSREAF